MPEKMKRGGTLFLVSGPSGAGKDAIIDGARRRLAADQRFCFPLRTITRPEGFGGEIHVAVTPAQFDRLRRRGVFALCWGARGLNYAVPISIEADLAAGRAVIVNASGSVIADAQSRYPYVAVIWIAASPEIRRRRLLARARESVAEIDERLGFDEEMPPDAEAEILVNEGSLDAAVDAFIGLIGEHAGLAQTKRRDLAGMGASERL